LPIFSIQATGNRQQATSGISGGESSNQDNQNKGDNSSGSSTSAHQHTRPTTRRVSGKEAYTTPSIRGALNEDAVVKDRSSSYAAGKDSAGSQLIWYSLSPRKN